MTKRKRSDHVIQIESGKWYAIAYGKQPFTEECCHCGLVHRTNFKIENGRFWVQYIEDEALTRRARARRARAAKKARQGN